MLFYGIITAIDLFTVVAYHDQRQKQVLSFYVKEVAKNTFLASLILPQRGGGSFYLSEQKYIL